MSRSPKGTKFQTDHVTYENLDERRKSAMDAVVMQAYDKGATWTEALRFCSNRGMKDGTFKNIDSRLKRLGVIMQTKLVKVPREAGHESALSRKRELLMRQISTATSADDNRQSPGEYVHDIQGRGTLADRLFWTTVKRIKDEDKIFQGLPRELKPEKYFERSGLFIVEYPDKVSWLWRIQNWLADASSD